eukprot:m.29695 g.29695  ORF g.29695 m.29695 type:complete len:55 (-) comp9194_c0_seq2:20-184(-)
MSFVCAKVTNTGFWFFPSLTCTLAHMYTRTLARMHSHTHIYCVFLCVKVSVAAQ